jgi:hypothetical protein
MKTRLKFEGSHGVGCLLLVLFWPAAIVYYLLKTVAIKEEK